MKTKDHISRYMLIFAWITLAALGLYIANRTYHYEVIVKGLLGFAVLCLLFFYVRHSGIDATLDTMILDPKKYRYLIFAFIGPIVAYWAMGVFYDMLFLLFKMWLNF